MMKRKLAIFIFIVLILPLIAYAVVYVNQSHVDDDNFLKAEAAAAPALISSYASTLNTNVTQEANAYQNMKTYANQAEGHLQVA